MTRLEFDYMPMFTTREVRNYGVFKKHCLYNYLFTKEENRLIETGALEFLPISMYKFVAKNDTTFTDKAYKAGEKIDSSKYDFNVLKILIKNNIVKCSLKDEYCNLSEKEIVEKAIILNCVGKTFKEVSDNLELDFEVIKKEFSLKAGANKKKITLSDIEKLEKIVEKFKKIEV